MNCQSINKTMLNTIRPDALASLRRVERSPEPDADPWKGKATSATSSCGETVSVEEGMHRVSGDRMAGSWSDMNQGSLFKGGRGRWKRERQKTGTDTVGSAREGSTRGRDPCPMGMGGTSRLDGTHVRNPGNGD